jgi:hypothetical protein
MFYGRSEYFLYISRVVLMKFDTNNFTTNGVLKFLHREYVSKALLIPYSKRRTHGFNNTRWRHIGRIRQPHENITKKTLHSVRRLTGP